jgi:glycosyltransferase involved in cell wall biosynthesis
MKLLVFAHKPPPHHGQSYMVQLMLEGFGGDRRHADGAPNPSRYGIDCYHVDARLSHNLEDIGDFRFKKVVLLLGFCWQAIWCRVRHGVTALYYIPAPGKRSALFRDWVVLTLCRPFFKQVILHWHAAGLGKWLETETDLLMRSLTYKAMGGVDLSIVLTNYNVRDAEKQYPTRIRIVNNGIPDPAPEFDTELLPRRVARLAARRKLAAGQSLTDLERREAGGDPEIYRVLFLAHCTREKGLFDTISAVLEGQRELRRSNSPIHLRLKVAGIFVAEADRQEFAKLMTDPLAQETIRYVGFLTQNAKDEMLRKADVLCFPTLYGNENQPVNLIEAFAYGLPVITTRWRSLPELLPVDYPGLVAPQDVAALAAAILRFIVREDFATLRQLFCRSYTIEHHLDALAEAFKSVAEPEARTTRVEAAWAP